MAPFDASICFDNGTYSDIVIKSGNKEFRCHKVIITAASDYFKKLLDRESAFAESKQEVIELKEDPEGAVEAVLRHIYNFNYDSIADLAEDNTPLFHLQLYVAAQKYLLPNLMMLAKSALQDSLHALDYEEAPDMAYIFECITTLANHEMYDVAFAKFSKVLVKHHLVPLMELEAFRVWAVRDGSTALGVLLAAVAHGHDTKEHTITFCSKCRTRRVVGLAVNKCTLFNCPEIHGGVRCNGTLTFTKCRVPDSDDGWKVCNDYCSDDEY